MLYLKYITEMKRKGTSNKETVKMLPKSLKMGKRAFISKGNQYCICQVLSIDCFILSFQEPYEVGILLQIYKLKYN